MQDVPRRMKFQSSCICFSGTTTMSLRGYTYVFLPLRGLANLALKTSEDNMTAHVHLEVGIDVYGLGLLVYALQYVITLFLSLV